MKLNKKHFVVISLIVFLLLIGVVKAVTLVSALDTGLVGYWKMDESSWNGTAGEVKDSVSTNNGTAFNGLTTTAGKLGNAGNFDGVNDYVSIANESNFDFERTQSFSIFAWIKLSSSVNQAIISKLQSSGNFTGYEIVFPVGATTTPQVNILSVAGSNEIRKRSSKAVNDGNWHYVGFTYNGSSSASGVNIYIDGVLDSSATVVKDTLTTSILNNVPVNIGARNTTIPFSGLIDDARIYNRVLTGSEIQQLYNPLSPTPTPTTGWTENWDSLLGVQSRWSSIGNACYFVPQPGILDMVCQSAGLVSKQYFDKTQTIEVSGTVRAQPNPGSTTDAYWGGLTLYNNNGLDNNYGELAAERNVPPFGGDHTARVVSLTNNIGAALTIDTPWTWHTFKINYNPNGTYNYYVDGNLVKTVNNVLLTSNPDIFVLCVSVGSGVVNDGSSSHCQFGPITVNYVTTTTPTPSPTPTPAPAKRVFVTKNWVVGNIGGLTGANSKCQSQANQVPLGGTWRAWLSDSTTSAASNITIHNSGPYKLVDGTIVANSWADLTDGSLINRIKKDQFGNLADPGDGGVVVWTNTKSDGSIDSTTNNCSNWSNASFYGAVYGNEGNTFFTDSQWSKFQSDNCSTYRPLYCFEQ